MFFLSNFITGMMKLVLTKTVIITGIMPTGIGTIITYMAVGYNKTNV